MIDVEERARRAGEAARAEARARAPRLAVPDRSPVRPSSAALVAAGVGLAGLLVVLGVATRAVPPQLQIDPVAPIPAESGAGVPVPDVGDVVAVQLADGTPVFVSQPVPGDVLVLDAVDPHIGTGVRKVLVFCRPSAVFEDPRDGSRFDQWGNWLGGPAPSGLALYPSEPTRDGHTVEVVGDRGPAPARNAPRGGPGEVQGGTCQLDEGTEVSAWVAHRPPEFVPSLDGSEIPRDRWVWASLVLAGPVDRLVVCAADGVCGAGPIVATRLGLQPDRELPPTTFVALARSTGDSHVDLVFPPAGRHPFDLVRFIEGTEEREDLAREEPTEPTEPTEPAARP
jgi:hypothetical protein